MGMAQPSTLDRFFAIPYTRVDAEEKARKTVLKSKSIIRWGPLALGITALLGMAVRFYGLDWDSILPRYQLLARLYGAGAAVGTNMHPDERQIMYQTIKLSWPSSWARPTRSPGLARRYR